MSTESRVQVVSDNPRIRKVLTRLIGSTRGVEAGDSISFDDAGAVFDAVTPEVVVFHAADPERLIEAYRLAERHPKAFTMIIVSDVVEVNSDDTPAAVNVVRKMGDPVGIGAEVSDAEQSDDEQRLDTLSLREAEVLVLTAKGLAIKEIAGELNLSPSTVGKHRDRLMKKVDVHDRVALARFAYRMGLVKP